MITTEDECKKACNSLERNFNVGRKLVNPGCFVNTQRTGNCQWANIVWGSRKGDKAVCSNAAPTAEDPTSLHWIQSQSPTE